jgi:hypothetical protein
MVSTLPATANGIGEIQGGLDHFLGYDKAAAALEADIVRRMSPANRQPVIPFRTALLTSTVGDLRCPVSWRRIERKVLSEAETLSGCCVASWYCSTRASILLSVKSIVKSNYPPTLLKQEVGRLHDENQWKRKKKKLGGLI